MALSSSFDSVLVRAKGVSLQPTCVRMCSRAQAQWHAKGMQFCSRWHHHTNLQAEYLYRL